MRLWRLSRRTQRLPEPDQLDKARSVVGWKNVVLDPKARTVQLLKPEMQDPDSFADGILNIAEAQQRVARQYFEDGSIAQACPPLQALLHIMAHGSYQGKGSDAPQFRDMFRREALLGSDWYQERLRVKQERDTALWRRHAAAP